MDNVKEVLGTRFEIAKLSQYISEASELHKLHWEEIKRPIPLNPHYEYLYGLEDESKSLYMVVKDLKTNALVGHIFYSLTNSYQTQEMIASEQFYYLLPEYRKGRLGLYMLEHSLDILKTMEVKEVLTVSYETNPVDKIYKHLGFKPKITTYSRLL